MDLAAYFAAQSGAPQPSLPVYIKGAVRADLPAFFAARGYTTGAEVGVYRGDYAEQLCQGVPGLRLICVDRWAPYISGKSRKVIFRSAVAAHEIAQARLAPYACTLLHMESVEAAKTVPQRSLDFVYLDADHWLPAVIADLQAWLPKVRPGGVIAGHDYVERLEEDNRVATAVRAWTEATEVNPWYVLGRSRVRPGEATERVRTWMWFV